MLFVQARVVTSLHEALGKASEQLLLYLFPEFPAGAEHMVWSTSNKISLLYLADIRVVRFRSRVRGD